MVSRATTPPPFLYRLSFNKCDQCFKKACKVLNHNQVRLKEQHEATWASKIFSLGRNLEQIRTLRVVICFDWLG